LAVANPGAAHAEILDGVEGGEGDAAFWVEGEAETGDEDDADVGVGAGGCELESGEEGFDDEAVG